MAEISCNRFRIFFFLILLLLSVAICCSGTVVGFSYESRSKTDISSIVKALSTTTLMQAKAFPFQFQVLVSNQGVLDSPYIYLKQTQHVNLRSHKAILISGSKTHLRSHISKLEIPSVIVSCSSLRDFPKANELQMLLPMLMSTKSLLKGLQLEKPVKVSVALPLSLLNSLNMKQTRHLDDILHHMRETKSFLIVEDSVDGEWSKADGLIQSIINKANLAVSLFSHADVPIILTIKSSVFPSASELSALSEKILTSLDYSPQIVSTLTSIVIEVSPTLMLQHSLSSHRELLTRFNHKSILHDSLYPPTTNFPTAPVYNPTTPVANPTTPTTIPPYNPTPTIVTIPGTNPVSGTPASPAAFPYTTPVSVTPAAPATNPVAPVTDPGTQPVTNPVTTYPPSTVGGVPSTTSPVTTPVTAPAVTNAPVVPGQTWCIAKSGAVETALQSALDYACGIGGADCSTIQEGASCYNPNTLENHASYAFNSYFQKNPTPTSCDFGGAAALVNTNPSSGTCVYPSSATTTAPSTIPPATTAAPSGIPPATTASTSGETGTGSSYGSPPSVLNTSSSPIGSSTGYGPYGDESPPIITAPPSGSAGTRTFFGFVVLTTSLAMTVLLGV